MKFWFPILVCFVMFESWGQPVSGDFRAVASGNWSSSSTWQVFDGTTWNAATSYPSGSTNVYLNIPFTGTITLGSSLVTNVSSTAGLQIGMNIFAGGNLASGTTITNIVGNTITLSAAAIATPPVNPAPLSCGFVGLTVTLDLPEAESKDLWMGGCGQAGSSGPLLQFQPSGAQTLTIKGSLSITGGSGTAANDRAGRPKLGSNGNSSATLVLEGDVFSSSSNTNANGAAGLNIHEGTTIFGGSTTATLTLAASARLGAILIGDGSTPKTVTFTTGAPTTFAQRLSCASLRVKANATLYIGGTSSDISGTGAFHLGNTDASIMNLSNGISIEPGATLAVQGPTASNTCTIELMGGGITNDGTFTAKASNGAFIRVLNVKVSGSNPNVISGTNPIAFNSLLINSASGLTLSQSTTVNDTLTLTDGKVTSTNPLTLGETAVVSGGNSSSFVEGPLVRTIASSSSTARTFPVGKGLAYRPLILTVTQNASTMTAYTVEMFNSSPLSRTLPLSLDRVSSVRHWTISKGSGAEIVNASVTLTYGIDDEVADASNLRVAKGDEVLMWEDVGGVGSGAPAGSITSTTGFSSFGEFVLANNSGGGNPLPIQLASFTVTQTSMGIVRVDWTTLTEINNYGFEIQKSQNQTSHYHTIPNSFVPGHGTTIEPQHYRFIDSAATQGVWYYRLKQIDLDGSVHLFEGARVEVLTNVEGDVTPTRYYLHQNYPNPFNPSTVINFHLPNQTLVSLKVYDLLGKEVATLLDEVKDAGVYNANWDASGYASGVYIYRLQAGAFREARKLVLVR